MSQKGLIEGTTYVCIINIFSLQSAIGTYSHMVRRNSISIQVGAETKRINK